MSQKRQSDHRAEKSQDANSPKGTHRLCGQHAPSMPYGGRDPQGARVLSRSVLEAKRSPVAGLGLQRRYPVDVESSHWSESQGERKD